MHQIPKLDKKGLRNFGLFGGGIIAVLFGLLFPWLRGYSPPVWPWIVLAILWIWALFAPTYLNLIYQVWMRIGLVLGWIETRIILGVVFYLLVVPMGILMRILSHKDPMHRELNLNISTYRIPSKVRTSKSMERPF